ncbi:LysM domain-containing protein [Rhodococcus sp. NCIMB 12038]|uniref:LysM peptidoglycan-binding domain-containing protein n=1 Tax=Rhodococcus sp. NCIMB 12038 TaxID=933800 RepID=UPI000B3CA768|nr:LysM domain-containing protein [Rhodococcus sp. NCIMB 12038]OUS97232.1 hypothetical protein CA951_02485 [Rhodococcus sp. NCIMB 12038]
MGLPNPITAIGSGLQNVGEGVGSTVTMSNDWLGDRAKDVVRGDVFGIARRENEALRQSFEERLNDTGFTIRDLREQLDKGVITGEPGSADLADTASQSVHGGKGCGALSKELDASYTVADGDTLTSIAQEKGKSVEDLLGLNPELGDGNLIHPGQEIKLDDFVVQDNPVGQMQNLVTPAVSTPEAGTELQA